MARCSVERTLANPGSLMELVGKEGEKMECRKGICFFVLGDTRVSIDRSIDRYAPWIPKIALQVSTFFSNAASADRMLHFVPDSRLTLQLFRNPIIVTRKLSPLSLPALPRYASPNENNFRDKVTSYSSMHVTRDSHVYASILFQNLETRSEIHRDIGKIVRKIFFVANFRSFTRLSRFSGSRA